MRRDLKIFAEDNQYWRSQDKRVPWEERLSLVEEQFPSIRNPDWNIILRDSEVFGRILKDILKVDQIEPGRAGPRPNIDYERGMQSWREITGQDYSELPFNEAFRLLSRGQSLTQIARKTGISRSKVHRLLQGDERPVIAEMRTVAESYGKKPAYFVEYRTEFIVAAIAARLNQEHETSVAIYRKLING